MSEKPIPPAGEAAPAARIEVDPAVLGGQPYIRGTRLSVEFLRGLAAIGWTTEKILEVYPYLTPADIEAAAHS